MQIRREQPTEQNGTNDCWDSPCETSNAHLDRVGWEDSEKFHGEEVDDGVEVHARNKRNEKGLAYDALSGEHFLGNHGVLGKFPLPNNPACDQGDANDELCENVTTGPRMGITTCLDGNKTA